MELIEPSVKGYVLFSLTPIIAALLHMILVKLDWFKFLAYPLDHYAKLKDKRIFGNHKTYRGVIFMIFLSFPGLFLVKYLNQLPAFSEIYLFDFGKHSLFFYALMYGLGWTLAELPNSFLKRQQNLTEGKRGSVLNVILDQSDSPAGILLLFKCVLPLSWKFILLGIVIFSVIHLFFNFILFLLKVRKQPV